MAFTGKEKQSYQTNENNEEITKNFTPFRFEGLMND